MSDVVKGFVYGGHIASAGLFAYGSISSGSSATTNFAVVGGATGGGYASTPPGLKDQPGSGPAVVADTSVQEGVQGDLGKAAGPKNSGPDPTLCASGLFECDWEAGTMRMNILIPDAPAGAAPAAGQTASWWARLKNWLFGAEPAAARGASIVLNRTPQALQKFFTKHGADFGLKGNWNPSRAGDASRAIHQHINSPAVRVIDGTYRGNPVTHYVDPQSGLNVIAGPGGNFVSGWRLGAEQLEGVLTTGRLF